ncbi:MAG: glycine cleavage system aminomethyltransferase GcvT [Alphaproteobacteria bacterium]|jgi:aminomethyltransferase|nr:glycine cleavage system aminomethyltransferase GcvT [Alphaproteobacteria bacterium]MDP6566431.1 glycine cleavage system aminomethyltransferase GcvT [Alphaproteobacteria bacterium]MDP6811611.1 glycine cleavage system aminomethyltransferase GcvT [Alphaproteobacteria bacterium]
MAQPTDAAPTGGELRKTPLHGLHAALGGKLVPFAGYEMPVQFAAGILGEHLHTRDAAGLFDVSHMGQARLRGDDPARALEALVPADIAGLATGAMRYTQLTNEAGGIIDDLMVTNAGEHLFLVVNGANKDGDLAHLRAALPGGIEVEHRDGDALLALQGPAAAAVLARLAPGAADLVFMTAAAISVGGIDCFVSRSGYTGEDGFEISLPGDRAEGLARRLLDEPEVEPIGLGARDSLRLEAGLCLHGHDIDGTTTPIEAGLTWSIQKRRRQEGGFPGAGIIQAQLRDGPARRRVGIRPDGRAPAREHTEILDAAGASVGTVTSGGFGPSVGGPVAMGYVQSANAGEGSELGLMVRGRSLAARVVKMPFVPQRYYRGRA